MPSYVNIGAYVMKARWLIPGRPSVLVRRLVKRPPFRWRGHRRRAGAAAGYPTIIEDNCFIGARSEVVEGGLSKKVPSSLWAYTLVRAPVLRP